MEDLSCIVCEPCSSANDLRMLSAKEKVFERVYCFFVLVVEKNSEEVALAICEHLKPIRLHERVSALSLFIHHSFPHPSHSVSIIEPPIVDTGAAGAWNVNPRVWALLGVVDAPHLKRGRGRSPPLPC